MAPLQARRGSGCEAILPPHTGLLARGGTSRRAPGPPAFRGASTVVIYSPNGGERVSLARRQEGRPVQKGFHICVREPLDIVLQSSYGGGMFEGIGPEQCFPKAPSNQ